MDAIRIKDFTNSTWHDGAARVVKVTALSDNTTSLTVSSGVINIPNTFSSPATSGDENRSVEAGFNKLKAGSFIVSETGTGPGGTIVLNQPVPKHGNYTLQIENGPGRAVLDATINGSNTVTSPTANFIGGGGISSDVGKTISGTGIPLGAVITAVNSSTSVTINTTTTDETATGGCDDGGTCGINIAEGTRNSTQRMVTDLSVNGSNIFSNSANFQTTDIGLLVKGTGLPANAYITAVSSATQATISAAATKPAADVITTIGLASATAPLKDGVDPVATLQTEIVLNPVLVAGSPDCGQNFAAGLDIIGVWNSPAKFALKRAATDAPQYFNDSYIGLSNRANQTINPLSTKPIIAQIQFKTPTVQFAGYVQEAGPGGAVDIVFPFVPTALGQCPSTSIASVFTFNADMQSQTLAPSGYGKAGSGGFRHNLGLTGLSPTATSTQSATYEGFQTGQTTLTGVTMTTSKQTPASTFTSAGHGLVEGQVVTVDCGLNCTADGLKIGTAYFVHVVDANNFQLSLTPFDAAHGVLFVPVAPKVSTNTVSVSDQGFSSVAGPFTNNCTVFRTAPMASDGTGPTDAFPCSAG